MSADISSFSPCGFLKLSHLSGFLTTCLGVIQRFLNTLNQELPGILASLAQDKPLPAKYRDHALTGDWAGRRECHIKPDLLLVYLKVDGVEFEDTIGELRLVRLGSHSEIFG